MKNTIAALIIFGFAMTCSADNQCQEKAEAKQVAKKALQTCLKTFSSDKSNSAEPPDECAAAQDGYVKASKEAKECFLQKMQSKKGTEGEKE